MTYKLIICICVCFSPLTWLVGGFLQRLGFGWAKYRSWSGRFDGGSRGKHDAILSWAELGLVLVGEFGKVKTKIMGDFLFHSVVHNSFAIRLSTS